MAGLAQPTQRAARPVLCKDWPNLPSALPALCKDWPNLPSALPALSYASIDPERRLWSTLVRYVVAMAVDPTLWSAYNIPQGVGNPPELGHFWIFLRPDSTHISLDVFGYLKFLELDFWIGEHDCYHIKVSLNCYVGHLLLLLIPH